jgi:DNA invertase Pin-like site-specific DNA recombinase
MLGIYTRLSKEDDLSNSIKNQIREGEEYAKLNNLLDNCKIYDEGEGYSGTLKIEKRPKLNQLVKDIESGLITHIWMRKQDRLARGAFTVLKFAEAIKNYNIHLYFGDKGYQDLNDYLVYFNLVIMAGVDGLKPAAQSIATKKSLNDNIIEGKAWGVLPYGYKTDDNMMLMVDEDEEKIVKRIFNYSLNGDGVSKIATTLNGDGIPTRYSSRYSDENSKTKNKKLKIRNKYTNKISVKEKSSIVWSDKTISSILSCKWYIGERTYSGETYPSPKIDVPFHQVQKGIIKRVHQKKLEYRYLLKGLIRCGKCERNYYGRTRPSKNDNFYMCSSKRSKVTNCGNASINIKMFESFIVKHLFKSKDLLNKLKEIDSTDNTISTLQDELNSLQDSLNKENKRSVNLINLLADVGAGDEDLIKKYKSTKTNLKTLKTKIINVEIRIEQRTKSKRIDELSKEINGFKINNEFAKVKQAVNNIIEDIQILSTKDKNNKIIYIIEIKYKGFDERSILTTTQPYNKWLWTVRTYTEPTPEDIQDDVDAFKFAYGLGIKSEDYHKYQSEFYSEGLLDPILIEPEDIVEYN